MNRIKVRRYRVALPDWNRPAQPIRIVMIGDLHNRVFGEANNKLVKTVIELFPDLVFSVGDLTVCKPGMETDLDIGVSLLKRLACECPVYCVNGNHEFRTKAYPDSYKGVYEKLLANYRKIGIHLLEDEAEDVDLKGAGLTVYGFELPLKYYKKMSREFITAEEIREHLGEPEEDRFNILLAHNPVFFESYALWGADLTLSGHLHGGSVRLPFVGGVVSPQIRLFPKYDCGLYQKYGRKLVVTAGLGTHSCAPRINNPAEVVLLELY